MEDLLRVVSQLLAIPIPVAQQVDIAVALWLVAGAIALRFNVAGWWWRRLILERAIALQRPEGELELGRQRLEAELVALLIQLALFGIGVLVATEPPQPPRPPVIPPPPWQSLLLEPIFLAVQFALAFESGRQRRYDRRRLHLPPATDEHRRLMKGDDHA